MADWFKRLKAYLAPEKLPPAEALEEFRKTFRAKFHAFKMLLNANNTALQLMAEMETTLHGQQSLGRWSSTRMLARLQRSSILDHCMTRLLRNR